MQSLRWMGWILVVAGWVVVQVLWGRDVALGAFLFLCGILVGYALRYVEVRLGRPAAAPSKGGT